MDATGWSEQGLPAAALVVPLATLPKAWAPLRRDIAGARISDQVNLAVLRWGQFGRFCRTGRFYSR